LIGAAGAVSAAGASEDSIAVEAVIDRGGSATPPAVADGAPRVFLGMSRPRENCLEAFCP